MAIVFICLGKKFKTQAIGSLLISISWVVNSYMKFKGLNSYLSYDELFRIPGYFLLFPIFNKLTKINFSKRNIVIPSLLLIISITFILIFTELKENWPWNAIIYLTILVSFFWYNADALNELLLGEVPTERCICLLGFLLLWFGVLIKIPDEMQIAFVRQESDAVTVVGYIFISVGVISEAKHISLKLWSFATGIAAILYALAIGLHGLKNSIDFVYISWLITGSIVLFLAIIILFITLKAGILKSELRLREWEKLLESIIDFAEIRLQTSEELKGIFFEIKKRLPFILGLYLNTSPPIKIGQSSNFSYPLMYKEQKLGEIFLDSIDRIEDIKPFTVIFTNKIHLLIRHMNLKLETLIDPLTGVLNRRGFEEAFKEASINILQYKVGYTIVFLDLDNFKTINDTLGHSEGDKLLYQFASILKQTVREHDLVVRWGGDEFLIILFNTNTHHAQEVLNRIKNKYNESSINLTTLDKKLLTFSAGLVHIDSTYHSDKINEYIQLADKKMYEAKKLGKNLTINQLENCDNNAI
jgi:diguanylate cyclase (GGDEF)-like protein